MDEVLPKPCNLDTLKEILGEIIEYKDKNSREYDSNSYSIQD